jgi:hypothetical protein
VTVLSTSTTGADTVKATLRKRGIFMSRFAFVIALALLLGTPAALAGQPVTVVLMPPPPSFESCKAVGNGTICEGSIASSYGPVDTGLACGSGASAFDIFDSASENEVARRVYDANGFLVRRDRHDRYVGQLSSPARDTSLPYTQVQEMTDELAVPGDFGSATTTITGQMHIRADGGAPVLTGAGRLVFGPLRAVEFQAGPSGFLDLLFGMPAAVDPICAGLGG